MKVVILVLALCGIAATTQHVLVERQLPGCAVLNETLISLVCFPVPGQTDIEVCTECAPILCDNYIGDNAADCRLSTYKACDAGGIKVPECLDCGQDEICLCSVESPVEQCRVRVPSICDSYVGDTAADCRLTTYETCDAIGVKVPECLDCEQDEIPLCSVESPVEKCRECAASICNSYVGDTAADCRLTMYETCDAIGVKVPECLDCEQDEIPLCSVESPVEQCRVCVPSICDSYVGDTAAECRQVEYDTCDVLGVKVPECLDCELDPPGFVCFVESPAEQCRQCAPTICNSYVGDTAAECRQFQYDTCDALGVKVPECLDCETDPEFICFIESPVEQCRICVPSLCEFYVGDTAAECRQFQYDTCDALGVKVPECGALALVTVKAVLAVFLLVAAFLVF